MADNCRKKKADELVEYLEGPSTSRESGEVLDNQDDDSSCWEPLCQGEPFHDNEYPQRSPPPSTQATESRQTNSVHINYPSTTSRTSLPVDDDVWESLGPVQDATKLTDVCESNIQQSPNENHGGQIKVLSVEIEDDVWESLDGTGTGDLAEKFEDFSKLNKTADGIQIKNQSPLFSTSVPSTTFRKRTGATKVKSRPSKQSSPSAEPRRQTTTNLKIIEDDEHYTKNEKQTNALKARDPVHIVWGYFLVYFSREVWNLNWQIRIALSLIVTGNLFNFIRWSLWCLYFPKQTVATLVLFFSLVYFKQEDTQEFLSKIAISFQSPFHLAGVLSELNPRHMRYTFILSFYVFPLLLEMNTIQLLVSILNGSNSNAYNFAASIFMMLVVLFLLKKYNTSPNLCVERVLWMMYGSALYTTVLHAQWWRFPLLAGPFLTPTGALWLKGQKIRNPDWLPQTIRAALRLTIRDSFKEMGEMVQQDEMLQLTMLRWIIDFWSSSTNQKNEPTSSAEGTTDFGNDTVSNHTGDQQVTRQQETQHAIDWVDICSMLNITTTQMEEEINFLQRDPTQNPKLSQTRQEETTASICSLRCLHSVFLNMDIDEQAKPAFLVYKRQIGNFPPQRQLAALVSITRRTPALNILVLQVLCGLNRSFLSDIIILLPLAMVEIIRIQAWAEKCAGIHHEETGENIHAERGNLLLSIIQRVDPMVLLLADDEEMWQQTSVVHQDNSVAKPVLLVVWQNILNSVAAFEVGLTAARCVQTASLAVDFAGNIVSLASFGFEVSQKGWLYGLNLLAKELIALCNNTSSQDANIFESRYTTAAFSVISNSERLRKNITVLAEEDGLLFLRPLLDIFPALIGRGWLWDVHRDNTVDVDVSMSPDDTSENHDSRKTNTTSSDETQKEAKCTISEDMRRQNTSVNIRKTESASYQQNDDLDNFDMNSSLCDTDALKATELQQKAQAGLMSEELISIAKNSRWLTEGAAEDLPKRASSKSNLSDENKPVTRDHETAQQTKQTCISEELLTIAKNSRWRSEGVPFEEGFRAD